jgi:hypothetical protein
VEQHREMCLEHHRASLAMLEHVAPGHPLVTRLAGELEHCCGCAPAPKPEAPGERRAVPARSARGPGERRTPDRNRW